MREAQPDTLRLIAAYVLAGGESRRFGSDKARAVVDDRPLLLHSVDALRERYETVKVVSAPGRDYSDLGVATIFDTHPDRGPLGGLHAALLDAGDVDAVALAPCDVVGLRAGWYSTLEARFTARRAAAFHADRWQPLVAVYPTSLLTEVTRRLETEELAMRSLLDAHGIAVDPPSSFATLRGVNSIEDLP